MALTHHETWDGKGYPQGLKGEAIPWPGRVIAIVDTFESMTTTQFHREPRSVEDAAAEIELRGGTRYDPKLVEAFKKALPVIKKVREAYSDALGDLINLDFAPKGAAKPAAALAGATRAPPPAPPKPAQPAKAAARTDARRK
jgi:putative two-component system response regulator